jgi:phage gp46-like protein
MTELALHDGDYVSDGAGGLQRATGQEALLRRVLFRLTARRGTFPFWEDLGSRLWQLGQLNPSARQAAAKQYVAEALAEETALIVEEVTLVQQDSGAELTVELSYEGETLPVTMELQI